MKNNNSAMVNGNMISYLVFVPGGNGTALVERLGYSSEARKVINDKIMMDNADIVEQVGFVEKGKTPELKMAGGEFCGNATRSAAFYYLDGKPGEMQIKVNDEFINAGVYENGEAWCEIPLYHGTDAVVQLDKEIYRVKMNGMTTLVISERASRLYLDDRQNLKTHGMYFIHHYHLEDNDAVGVMFLEEVDSVLKINPVVWVRSIDTLFYETACGSGTTATVMVESFLKHSSCEMDILQPSGHKITAQIKYDEGKIVNARISGVVCCDNVVRRFAL